MTAYYNEIDPKAAAWLRELIREGHIAPGVVDERSIEDISPNDLRDFTQCHFFAGIGGWSYALRLAGIPDEFPVWTGSCPCQPFSAAGKRIGLNDERHLWPAWWHLITQRRPSIIFGEQVSSKDGLAWLDIVSTDLEASGYAVGAADLCAAGVGAPHIRQRLYLVAHSGSKRLQGERLQLQPGQQRLGNVEIGRSGQASHLADANGRDPSTQREQRGGQHGLEPQDRSASGLAHAYRARSFPAALAGIHRSEKGPRAWNGEPIGRGYEFWADCDWIPCRDGKARPVEPGTFPLAHGIPDRVGLLRGYGNAIVPQVAQAFIEAALGL